MNQVIICDIDGTLALCGDRNPYDASTCEQDGLNHPVASIIKHHAVILVSGRMEDFRPHTERWLKVHDINYGALFMRPSGDTRKDYIVKKEIYDFKIKDKYNVLFVVEDRTRVVRMWREQGLVCLQCADGDF
mgnify:CR=1 FL=1